MKGFKLQSDGTERVRQQVNKTKAEDAEDAKPVTRVLHTYRPSIPW